jgi:hypothetical protein
MSNEPSPDDIPEVLPVPEPPRHRPACSHCGGDDITKSLKLSLAAEARELGIHYEATGKFLGISLLGIEPLHIDVCNSCGTVTRIYVQNLERKWS